MPIACLDVMSLSEARPDQNSFLNSEKTFGLLFRKIVDPFRQCYVNQHGHTKEERRCRSWFSFSRGLSPNGTDTIFTFVSIEPGTTASRLNGAIETTQHKEELAGTEGLENT